MSEAAGRGRDLLPMHGPAPIKHQADRRRRLVPLRRAREALDVDPKMHVCEAAEFGLPERVGVRAIAFSCHVLHLHEGTSRRNQDRDRAARAVSSSRSISGVLSRADAARACRSIPGASRHCFRFAWTGSTAIQVYRRRRLGRGLARYSLSPLLDASGATYRVDRLLAECWYRMFMRPRGSEAATVAAQQTC